MGCFSKRLLGRTYSIHACAKGLAGGFKEAGLCSRLGVARKQHNSMLGYLYKSHPEGEMTGARLKLVKNR